MESSVWWSLSQAAKTKGAVWNPVPGACTAQGMCPARRGRSRGGRGHCALSLREHTLVLTLAGEIINQNPTNDLEWATPRRTQTPHNQAVTSHSGDIRDKSIRKRETFST